MNCICYCNYVWLHFSFKEIFLLWNQTYLGGPVMTGQLPLGLKLRPIWSNRPRVWTHSCRDRQEFRTWKTFWKIRENHLLMNHHEFALAKGILFCKKSIHFFKNLFTNWQKIWLKIITFVVFWYKSGTWHRFSNILPPSKQHKG